MKIHFKTGETKIISQEVAEIINKQLIKGCATFQTFSNTDGKLELVINLTEILYVDQSE